MGDWDGQQARAKASHDDAPHVAQHPAPSPKDTNGAQADKMVGSRLGNRATAPGKTEYEFGEAVVGSSNSVEQISAPWNLAEMPAIASFSVSGEGFELVSTPTLTLPSSGAMSSADVSNVTLNSPKVAFKPQRAGDAHGTLTIAITWPIDGHVETQKISLHGAGRGLKDAPAQGPAGPAAIHDTTPPPDAPLSAKDKRTPIDLGMDDAIDDAARAADDLADAQARGVKLAADDAGAYKKAMPKIERSIWWDLAESALTIATGQIASYVARGLLPRLMSTTTTEEVFTETVTTTTAGELGPKLTFGIESGMKLAGGMVVKTALPSKSPAQPREPNPEKSSGHNSTNARIDFFDQQQDWAKHEGKIYHQQVRAAIHHVAPLMRKNPEQAQRVLEAVKTSFDESQEQAKLLQAQAVAPAWVSAVARMNLGVESVETRNHEAKNATNMDVARTLDKSGHAAAANGVLDVYVSPAGKIVSAQLNGVSQETADRLADMSLANVPMPIRFVLGSPSDMNPTIITRDETGRIRVSGDIHGNQDEANNVKTASEMIQRLLSVPLSSVQPEIKTDDATGHGG